jgi:MFS family permease
VVGGLISQPSFLDALGNPGPGYLGTIIALYDVGCMIGCVTAAIVGLKVGRRYVIFAGCMVMIVGAAIQASTHGAGQFIAGRIICGIGNGKLASVYSRATIDMAGLNTWTIPVYVSETTRSNRRGSMVALQLTIVIVSVLLYVQSSVAN